MRRLLAFILILASWAAVATAQDWGAVANISTTMGVQANRLCVGEASRGDIGCPTYAPSLTTTGDVQLTGGLTTSNISLTTVSTTWGYLNSTGYSYIPNLATGAISASSILINGQPITGGTSPTNVPAFRATKGGTSQSLTTSASTKLTWSGTTIDTYSNFASNRFTPTIAGYYLLHVAINCSGNASGNACVAKIFKNGAVISTQNTRATSFDVSSNALTVVYMNGSTDYAEAYAMSEASTASISGDPTSTYFEGSLIASGNGLVSGTGVTSLAALTDVSATGQASGTVLTYNGTTSKWEALAATGGLGYAITSGTTSVTANSATSVISLTTAGTTWGYLGSTASYLPYLNSTGISATNVTLTTINGQPLSNFGSSSPTNVPAFHVSRGGTAQTVTANTNVKILFTTKELDTYNNFDTSTSRFTPTVAGNYYINGSAWCNGGTSCYITLMKNGSNLAQAGSAAISEMVASVNTVVYMNGTTDYLELYGNSSSTSFAGGNYYTYMSGSLLASGNGLVSGTGVSSLSALTDVTLSTPTSGSILTYNAATSKWVNVPLQSTISTTTILSGWPDAIQCTMGGQADTRILYLTFAPYTVDGRYYYRSIENVTVSNNVDTQIGFDSSGAYATYASTVSGYTSAGTCAGQSISQLYAANKAFNFIGGSGAVSSTAGLGYAITSGTTSVTANSSTSVISLTTAGTTWGYLGSTGSYLPNLGTTAISTTNISLTTINGQPLSSFGGASPTNVPAFRASKTANQTVPSNTYTKILLNTESYDTYSNFDTSTGRYTPTIAGYYLFVGQVRCLGTAGYCYASIYKNGTSVVITGTSNGGGDEAHAATILLYMNGSTDYVELYGYATATTITSDAKMTFLQGSLIASGNGLVSGTGVTALSALSDVSVTTPVSGSVLTYNGTSTKWEPLAATGGLGYALTSGTLSVTANSNTSVVSLTTAGTTWGYLGSTGSYLPNLGTTAISTTNISLTTINGLPYAAGGASPTNVPAFNVNKNSVDQTGIAASTFTKITFSNKVLDNYNAFNTSTSRYTPTVAGNYIFSGSAYCTPASSCYVAIYKNGSIFNMNGSALGSGTQNLIPNTTAVVPMNGTTDYVELYIYMAGSSTLSGATTYTNFSGSLLASGNGLVSGTGVTALSALTDVNTASAGLGSVLQYNGTTWNAVSTSALTSGSQVAFSANKNSTSQAVTTSTWTKITLTNVVFDTNNNFASSRFTPTIPGKYQINGSIYCSDAASGQCHVQIRKNGSNYIQALTVAQFGMPKVTGIIDMNGTTDYLELWGLNSGGTVIDGASPYTYLNGALINAVGSSGSGGGATTLSALTDVSVTTPVSGSVLTYNGTSTRWEPLAATGGLGYAITSGTTSVTANSSTAVISLTTAGTTWGYLGSTGSYLPNLGTTAISTTNISLTTINGLPYTGGASPTNVPAFRAKLSADQTGVTSGIWVKVLLNTKDFDTYNNFDTTNNRFRPTVAGYYYLTAGMWCGSASVNCYAAIYKNGSLNTYSGNGSNVANNVAQVSALTYMNGSTDYVELYAQTSGSTFGSGGYVTFLNGSLVASGNGLVSGTTTSAAGSTGQIQFNTSNAFAASANLTWDNTNARLGAGAISATNISASTVTLSDNPVTACNPTTYGTFKVQNGRPYFCRAQ